MDALSRLAGGVAHDFNNLLVVIGSCAELVEESLDTGHEAREDVAVINDPELVQKAVNSLLNSAETSSIHKDGFTLAQSSFEDDFARQQATPVIMQGSSAGGPHISSQEGARGATGPAKCLVMVGELP